MKPNRAKYIAVMSVGVTVLFVSAMLTLRTLHQQAAPGSGDSVWRDVCFGILMGMFIIILSLGYACIVRCDRKPEQEQERCKWRCVIIATALSALLFLLTILFCAPPSLPSGPGL
ncbi:MAG: hypothetical protein KIT57_05600 [Blastocatellales bacterium]|nr:hypothetical protein [Blastocatellales bacterium]